MGLHAIFVTFSILHVLSWFFLTAQCTACSASLTAELTSISNDTHKASLCTCNPPQEGWTILAALLQG